MSSRPAIFASYDFFRLLITFARGYNSVLASFRFDKLLLHCITVALFLKIKKPVIGIATNSQDFVKLVEVGLDHYSYGFQPLLSTFAMPIFLRSRGIITSLDFSLHLWGCITVAFKCTRYKNLQLFYKFELRSIQVYIIIFNKRGDWLC